MNVVQRAYKYRFYPDAEQENVLARTFRCARYVYNWGLRLRTDAFYEHQQRMGYAGTCKRLTSLKQQPDTLWLSECSNVVLQQALSNLDTAFKNFFQGRAKRRLSRKQKGSKNRAKAKTKVARIHARIADQRRDWQHKLTTKMVHENQVISVESLKIKNGV